MKQTILNQIAELERFIATEPDALALPRAACELAHGLMLSSGARSAVEVGTSYGYSGLWLAAAVADASGTLRTIDHDSRKLEAARVNFERAGLQECVELVCGEAMDVLGGLEGPIDFVLLDADKENCMRYVELLDSKLADRGIVLTDNTQTHREQLAPFVDWMRRQHHYFSCGVAIGNGLELSVRLPK